jgi:hypothetical protein
VIQLQPEHWHHVRDAIVLLGTGSSVRCPGTYLHFSRLSLPCPWDAECR